MTQENPSPESGATLKTPEGGKRPRKLTDKDTLKRALARKATERLRRTADRDKHLPLTRGTEGAPLQGSAPQEGETGAISSDRPTREHKAPSPLLPQTLRHIELRRRLGQNKAFLPALERALIKARGRLDAHHQILKKDPTSRENEDGQGIVWLLEDSIQRVKAGIYHLR